MTEQEKMLLYNRIGKKIREFREKEKIKQTDFAKMLEISRASVVNIEKARQHPPLHLIFDIARVLKVKITDLIPTMEKQDDKQNEKIISKKTKNYLNKWVENNELNDPKNTLEKIKEFLQENKS